MRQPSLLHNEVWIEVKDGNDTARDVFNGHYSRRAYRDGRKPLLFVGPGEKIVLITPRADALFVWRKFISRDGQQGVNCAVFRNESETRSSALIRKAEGIAWGRWPGERLYTYVNPQKIKSINPGCCFKKAGWRRCGMTKKGLVILEKYDSERRFQMKAKECNTPVIVCLCGSTRFGEVFSKANLEETLAGRIVLTVGCDFKSDEALGLSPDVKERLDELHKRKIDLADEILVLNVGGYIGASTRSEIEYATAHGKRVRYLEQ